MDYQAVWCEQHEDFLGEISEDLFDAYQIKTRKPELGEWDLNDEDIKKSISRFIQLNRAHPSSIRRFLFVSNAKVSNSSAKSKKYLSPLRLKDAVREVESFKKLSNASRDGFEHLKDKLSADPQELFTVLRKLEFANGPALESIDAELALNHIGKLEECSTFNATLLGRAREALIQKIHQASSLATDDPARHYVAMDIKRRGDPFLRAKRVSLDDVTLAVREVRGGNFTYLPSLSSLKLGSASEKLDILQKKMVYGGLAHQYETMSRRALSAEQILIDLVTRSDDGQQILSQIENVVLGECSDAEIRTSQAPEPSGAKMLIEVQDRLKRLSESEPARVLHQHSETLVGVAGLLTSDCKVWWSKRFNLELPQ